MTAARHTALESIEDIALDKDADAPFEFPTPKLPAAFHSIITLTQSLEICTKSPFPRLHHWVALTFDPTLRPARLHKDHMIQEQLEKARQKFATSEGFQARSAIDLLVQREATLAKKEQRQSGQNMAAIKDELFGFLLAGHDTTATSESVGVTCTDNISFV